MPHRGAGITDRVSWSGLVSILHRSTGSLRRAFGRTAHARLHGGVFLLTVLAAICGIASADADGARRIVTLSPHLAELVCAAGGCDRLVGVSAHSDDPLRVSNLPQVGDAFSINLEVVLNLRPDLVLAWQGGTPEDRIGRLRGLGLRVEAVSSKDLDDVADTLERIGGWIGTPAPAREAAQAYRARLASLRERWRGAAPIRVVYQIETAPAYTVNGTSTISEALSVCGGVNVFAQLPTVAAPVSPEAMLAARPDAVIYGGDENQSSIRAYWERLRGSRPQRDQTLYAVNASWLTRATPRLLDGIEQACGRLDQARRRIAAESAAG